MNNMNSKISQFLALLNSAWPQLQVLNSEVTDTSYICDWLQFNWELAFENAQVRLVIYGDGADINGDSSRVSFPQSKSSHAIYCNSKSGQKVQDLLNNRDIVLPANEFILDRFVTMKPNGWYDEGMPFDKVLIEYDDAMAIVDINEIDFILMPIIK